MALDKERLGSGGAGFQRQGPGTAEHQIRELQGLKMVVAAGAAADTDITATGAKTTDTVMSALMFDTGVPSDVTAEVSFTAADTMQLSDTDSTGNTLVVWYWSKP